MYVATFKQTSGSPFVADKNGNFPFIGTIAAGKSKGSIINGTIFEREGLSTGKLYLCENSVDPNYPDNVQTEVLSVVSPLELVLMRKELGEAINLKTSNTPAEQADVVIATAEAEIPTV